MRNAIGPLIFVDLRKETLANDSAERDVRNRNTNDEPNDVKNTRHLRQRHSARSEKTADN